MSDPCPDCGRDRVLVGMRHNCVPPRIKAADFSKMYEQLAVAEQDRVAKLEPGTPTVSVETTAVAATPATIVSVSPGQKLSKTVLYSKPCQSCVTLRGRIAELEAVVATAVVTPLSVETTAVATTPATSVSIVTTECPTCAARRAAKTAAQKRFRTKRR